MKYLVIGSGGREHCLAWRLTADGSAKEVYVAPGNGGIDARYALDADVTDFDSIQRICVERKIDVVVVGPEAPLAAGMVDFLNEKKIPAFGPTRKAAMLEGSKLFAKRIMEKYGVPTAGHVDFNKKEKLLQHVDSLQKFPTVIKLDGLAAGKGVCVAESREEAREFVMANVADNAEAFVEEFIDGEEASVLGISDGENVLAFIAAQDHKRIFEGDKGPNTGGMGAYAPAPVMPDDKLRRVHDEVLAPVIAGMKKEGIPFKGILYAGIIVRGDELSVLEFNVRFGDPEAQALLPLMEGKLGDVIGASINGTLKPGDLRFSKKHAITVVMSSGGYPGDYEKGKEIRGLGAVAEDVLVFHAGTRRAGDAVVTSGGRVLNLTAVADSLQKARDRVYDEIRKISFDGAFYRGDIAHRAIRPR